MRLEVTDSGQAIDPSTASEIFDRSGEASRRRSRTTAAAFGLGLFIVREIPPAHGGEVEVHPDGGQTTFAVQLPRGRRVRRPESCADLAALRRAPRGRPPVLSGGLTRHRTGSARRGRPC